MIMNIRALLALLLLPSLALAQSQSPVVITQPPGVQGSQVPFNLNNINIAGPPYNAKADTVFKTDGTVAASSAAFSSASSTFTASDVGKLISIPYVGSMAGATLNTTIATFVDANDITLTAPATLGTTSKIIPAAIVATSQSGGGSYAPGDTLTVSGGTSTTAATFSVTNTLLASASVNAAGSGGTNGACTLTGTTGTGTKFVIQATITANAISALGTITIPGVYTVNPTSLAAEPVTSNCSLAGSPTLTLKMGVATATATNVGVYSVIPSNPASTTTGGSGTGATLTVGSVTPGNFSYGTDNATGIGNAITAAQTAGVPLYIPAPRIAACYGFTPPLTVTANLSVIGDWAAGNWNGQINVPNGTPAVSGSVLCPISNGSDAWDETGTTLSVPMSNVGFLFQTPFIGTGDGIHNVPSANVGGLTDSILNNVIVYGTDGNHYGFNLTNPLILTLIKPTSYGGGGFKIAGNSSSGQYGNSTFIEPYAQVIVGGSADGYNLSASQSAVLNLMTFLRPQAIVENIVGVSPSGNSPSSTQYIWRQDVNSRTINVKAADFETTVSSPIQMGTAGLGNDLDFSTLAGSFASIQAPAWSTNGLMFQPLTRTLTDTTSSGTIAEEAAFALQGFHQNFNSSTVATNLDTLLVGAPICGTNCTATNLLSIHAIGQIQTDSAIVAKVGAFISGTGNTTINKNSSTGTTEIGDGSTSGTVTIGGGSNTTVVGSTLSVTGVSTAGTIAGSVCMTSAHLLLYESGATGCTISRADLKNIDGQMTVKDADRILSALQPIAFDWETAPAGDKTAAHQQLGFTAENVRDADPRLSTYDGNGELQAYDPNGLIAMLVVKAQEHERRLNEQRLWLIMLSIIIVLLAGSQAMLWRRPTS